MIRSSSATSSPSAPRNSRRTGAGAATPHREPSPSSAIARSMLRFRIDLADEPLAHICQNRTRHWRSPLIAQHVSRSAARAEQCQRTTQLETGPWRSRDAEALERPHEIRSGLRRPGMLARVLSVRAALTRASSCSMLRRSDVGSGPDALRGERRDCTFGDERQCPGKLQDIQRVSVHDWTLRTVTRVPRAPRAQWC